MEADGRPGSANDAIMCGMPPGKWHVWCRETPLPEKRQTVWLWCGSGDTQIAYRLSPDATCASPYLRWDEW